MANISSGQYQSHLVTSVWLHPEIDRVLKIGFIPKGDPHVTLSPGSRVVVEGVSRCREVKFSRTSRQFMAGLTPPLFSPLFSSSESESAHGRRREHADFVQRIEPATYLP